MLTGVSRLNATDSRQFVANPGRTNRVSVERRAANPATTGPTPSPEAIS